MSSIPSCVESLKPIVLDNLSSGFRDNLLPGVHSVTLRDVTERPETIECGSNMLSGCEPEAILRCVTAVLAHPPAWQPPAEYLEANVSSKVAKIVLGYRYGAWGEDEKMRSPRVHMVMSDSNDGEGC